MSPGAKKVECFSPMLCHCKVACTNSTISLMFGCKVGGKHPDARRNGGGGVPGAEWRRF
eukprot:superscaffoldBa00015240_g26550